MIHLLVFGGALEPVRWPRPRSHDPASFLLSHFSNTQFVLRVALEGASRKVCFKMSRYRGGRIQITQVSSAVAMDTRTTWRKRVFILCSKFLPATKILKLKFELWLKPVYQESCDGPRARFSGFCCGSAQHSRRNRHASFGPVPNEGEEQRPDRNRSD